MLIYIQVLKLNQKVRISGLNKIFYKLMKLKQATYHTFYLHRTCQAWVVSHSVLTGYEMIKQQAIKVNQFQWFKILLRINMH